MVTKKKDFTGKGRPNFQATGQIFFRILPIGMNCLHLTSKLKNSLALQANLCVTAGESVVSSSSSMTNCNHEETDTRIVVHILHALNQNMKCNGTHCKHQYSTSSSWSFV